MLRICERPLSEASGQNFNDYFLALWNIVVTMTTVGYGDVFPKTNIGRLIGSFICFWGCILVSLFVVSISEALEFTSPQQNAYTLIKRMLYRDGLKKYAANAVSTMWKYKRLEIASLQAKKLMRSKKEKKKFATWQKHMKRYEAKVSEGKSLFDNWTEFTFIINYVF